MYAGTHKELTDAEIAKMAIRYEEKGQAFYTAAAQAADDSDAKQIFQRLAEEEKEHAQAFKQILDSLPIAREAIFGGTGSAAYIQAILDRNSFTMDGGKPPAVNSVKEALGMGIQAEKDSILFYHELFNDCRSSEAKRTLEKLLEAEKMHLVELRDRLEDLI